MGVAIDQEKRNVAEETLELTRDRRRADRVIWAGLGRLPGLNEPPTIVIEFVSKGRISRDRDYVAKHTEYREIGVKQYWIIDRFAKSMTVCIFAEAGDQGAGHPRRSDLLDRFIARFRVSARQAHRPGEPVGQGAEVSWVSRTGQRATSGFMMREPQPDPFDPGDDESNFAWRIQLLPRVRRSWPCSSARRRNSRCTRSIRSSRWPAMGWKGIGNSAAKGCPTARTGPTARSR